MSQNYIQIYNNQVINIMLINPDTDYMDSVYTWIQLGTNKCTDDTPIQIGITKYDGTNFISNIIGPTLSDAINKKITEFIAGVLGFINTRYDLETRVNFLGIYINAKNKGLVNKAAYFQQLLDWQNNVYLYSAYVQYGISSLINVQDVINYNWDFTTLIASDPLITYRGAFSITD